MQAIGRRGLGALVALASPGAGLMYRQCLPEHADRAEQSHAAGANSGPRSFACAQQPNGSRYFRARCDGNIAGGFPIHRHHGT